MKTVRNFIDTVPFIHAMNKVWDTHSQMMKHCTSHIHFTRIFICFTIFVTVIAYIVSFIYATRSIWPQMQVYQPLQ